MAYQTTKQYSENGFPLQMMKKSGKHILKLFLIIAEQLMIRTVKVSKMSRMKNHHLTLKIETPMTPTTFSFI
jgi:hypothetical protein